MKKNKIDRVEPTKELVFTLKLGKDCVKPTKDHVKPTKELFFYLEIRYSRRVVVINAYTGRNMKRKKQFTVEKKSVLLKILNFVLK